MFQNSGLFVIALQYQLQQIVVLKQKDKDYYQVKIENKYNNIANIIISHYNMIEIHNFKIIEIKERFLCF